MEFNIIAGQPSCYVNDGFYAFDHAISNAFDIKYMIHDYDLIPIPNDETPSDHYPIIFSADIS